MDLGKEVVRRMLRWNELKEWWIVILLLAPILWGTTSNAQIADQNNAWLMYFGNHRLSDRWGLHTEYQWRRHGLIEHWQQSLMRIGLDHRFAQGAMVTAGYGWIRSFPYGEMPIADEFDEHRIWQQMNFDHRIGRFHFNHRYRLEQRFMEQPSATADRDPDQIAVIFRQRARYRLFVSLPLFSPELKDNGLFLALYDEPFLQFGRNIGSNVLDQNRLYVALGWRIDRNRNIQLGYLNHYVIKADGARAERNHTLQLGITWNLDLRRAESGS